MSERKKDEEKEPSAYDRRAIKDLMEGKNSGEEYEAALADAARRAHDAELAALANLALIRSSLDRIGFGVRDEKNMEDRLRDLVSDLDDSDLNHR